MRKDTFKNLLTKAGVKDKEAVQIYAYDVWQKLINTKAEDFKEARLIMCGASNIKEGGFLYSFLSNHEIHSISNDKKLITILVKGNPKKLRKELLEAADRRKAEVYSYNLENHTDQLRADFVF